MKRNYFCLIIAAVFLNLSLPVFASESAANAENAVSAPVVLDKDSVIHSVAASSDGEWEVICTVQQGGERDCEENVWLVSRDFYWNKPELLLHFYQGGWAVPTVCTNYKNNSFLVYYPNWTPGHHDGGIYEFVKSNDKYSSKKFNNLEIEYGSVGKLYSNQYGNYLVCLTGEYHAEKDTRNSTVYEITSENNELAVKEIDALKEIEFSHIVWQSYDNRENYSHTFRDVAFATEDALILLDASEKDWWLYNCENKTLNRFDTKEAAFEYDKDLLEEKLLKKMHHKYFFRETLFIIIFFLLFSAAIVMIILHTIKLLSKKSEAPVTIDDLDTKEKNRFIFNVQEKERSKISRDIHDSIIQDIRVIRLQTENLEVTENSKQAQNKLEDLATDCIIKLRNICYNLTPAELISHTDGASSQIELVSIITSLANQFTARTHVPCSVGVAPDFEYPVLEKEVTQNLFRVVQEALTNVEKHSYATKVNIYLNRKEENLIIYISDDGVGCNPEKLKEKMMSKEHLGLRSMKDRMDLIGGKIEFNTNQNDGMEVRLQLAVYKKE